MEMIADRVLATRDQTWEKRDEQGWTQRRTVGVASLGGATTFQQDLANSDCIVIQGLNMAGATRSACGPLR